MNTHWCVGMLEDECCFFFLVYSQFSKGQTHNIERGTCFVHYRNAVF